MAAADAIKILGSYARCEVLWSSHSEDAELKVIRHSGVEYSRSYDTNNNSDETIEHSPTSPQLREYFPEAIFATATSIAGIDKLIGRQFLNALSLLCLDALRTQSLNLSSCVELLFALVVQRPRLVEASLIKSTDFQLDADLDAAVPQFSERWLQRYGRLLSGVTYELMRKLTREEALFVLPTISSH